MGTGTTFASALAESKDQQDKSSYIQLFREEGKAEHVLSDNDFAALRGSMGTMSDLSGLQPPRDKIPTHHDTTADFYNLSDNGSPR